jgi:hypothetical protein
MGQRDIVQAAELAAEAPLGSHAPTPDATAAKIGFRTKRPYVMNVMRRPSTALNITGVISRYLTWNSSLGRFNDAMTQGPFQKPREGSQPAGDGLHSPAAQLQSRKAKESLAPT